MEASVGERFYHMGGPDLRGLGKRSLEWDLTDWKWDGDLFIATPLHQNAPNYQSRQFFPVETGNLASSNSSSSCSEEVNHGMEQQRRELEKRRRVIVVEEDDSGPLSLKLGGQGEPATASADAGGRDLGGNWDGAAGKRTKLVAPAGSRAVCQVDDCGTDLSKAKDYHRRHKVCEMHSKASRALVGNVMQRFCQQCSRSLLSFIMTFCCFIFVLVHFSAVSLSIEVCVFGFLFSIVGQGVVFSFFFLCGGGGVLLLFGCGGGVGGGVL